MKGIKPCTILYWDCRILLNWRFEGDGVRQWEVKQSHLTV